MQSEYIDPSYERLWAIIKDCHFAMLTTIDAEGSLRARPMTTVQKEFSGRLWFFVPRDSEAVHDVEENANVCVAYADTGDADFVAVSGYAAIATDVSIKQKLWNPAVQAWFPQGAESPDVALIKVYANHAEYWDSKSSKLVQLFSMASAYLRGTPPRTIGTHREVKIDRAM